MLNTFGIRHNQKMDCDLVTFEEENKHQIQTKTTAGTNSDTEAAVQVLGIYPMPE